MENQSSSNDPGNTYDPQKINQQFDAQFNKKSQEGKVPIPDGTRVLVLGIISIAGCFSYGLPGLICGIIALIKAKRSYALLAENPDGYTTSSLRNLKSGRTCATIGVIVSSIAIVFFICLFTFMAFASSRHHSPAYYNNY